MQKKRSIKKAGRDIPPLAVAPLSEEEKTDVATLAIEHMQATIAQVGMQLQRCACCKPMLH